MLSFWIAGIVSSQGSRWQEQRHFAHRVFREFGMGKAMLEDKLRVELCHFIHCIKHNLNGPISLKPFIQTAVANVVTSIMFGKRFHYADPKFKQHVAIMNRNAEIVGQCSILTVFPLLRYLPWDPFGFHQLKATAHITRDSYTRCIEEHRADLQPERKDFIDAYLQEIHKNKDNPETTFTGKLFYEHFIFLVSSKMESRF